MVATQLNFDFDAPVTIPLTQGYSTIVSPQDADLVGIKWYASRSKHSGIYAAHYPYNQKTRKTSGCVLMHRVILSRMLGRGLLPNELVDHADRNGLDNRRENLRLATRSQNMANSKTPSTNTSGYRGVTREYRKWKACITVNGTSIYLGLFPTPEEAYIAYCEAAKKYHGEYWSRA